jgi:hypothetical protein
MDRTWSIFASCINCPERRPVMVRSKSLINALKAIVRRLRRIECGPPDSCSSFLSAWHDTRPPPSKHHDIFGALFSKAGHDVFFKKSCGLPDTAYGNSLGVFLNRSVTISARCGCAPGGSLRPESLKDTPHDVDRRVVTANMLWL